MASIRRPGPIRLHSTNASMLALTNRRAIPFQSPCALTGLPQQPAGLAARPTTSTPMSLQEANRCLVDTRIKNGLLRKPLRMLNPALDGCHAAGNTWRDGSKSHWARGRRARRSHVQHRAAGPRPENTPFERVGELPRHNQNPVGEEPGVLNQQGSRARLIQPLH